MCRVAICPRVPVCTYHLIVIIIRAFWFSRHSNSNNKMYTPLIISNYNFLHIPALYTCLSLLDCSLSRIPLHTPAFCLISLLPAQFSKPLLKHHVLRALPDIAPLACVPGHTLLYNSHVKCAYQAVLNSVGFSKVYYLFIFGSLVSGSASNV